MGFQTTSHPNSQPVLQYALGDRTAAFTTDRTIGRDPEKVKAAVCAMPLSDGTEFPLRPGELRFVRPHQTHSDRVLPVAEEFLSLSESVRAMLMDGVDALMTDVRNVVIGVSTADCIPVLVYDPEHHAAAAIHAGWRGTVQRIVMKTVEAMCQMYHTDPTRCTAAIGPGISLDSFEVGDEVYSAFAGAGFVSPRVARRFPNMHPAEGEPLEKWHIDLKEINRQQLVAAGLKEQGITVSDVDTFTDERFFSARREQTGQVKCGRIFTGIVVV